MTDRSPNPRADADIVGQMAGEYQLLRKLGEGGFGAVYEAEHPLLRRRAAVKVLHQVARMDSEAVLRFVAEAQAANQIRSRHIVDIFSFGTLVDGRPFFVMDLLHGEPLDHTLAREQRIDVATALRLLRPLADALDAAHGAGIVHRDLKPQNVFLVWEPGGETVPKLLDFGTAKLLGDSLVQTGTGSPVGTPLYMAPEQARGERVDGRADVYALGVLCHEMLTGQLPISGSSTIAVLMAQLTQPPPRVSSVAPDLSPELDQPILRMMEKDPAARPATAGAAMGDLVRAAERAGHVIAEGMPRLPPPPRDDRGEALAPIVRGSPPLSPRPPSAPEPAAAAVISGGTTVRRRRSATPFVVAVLVLAGGGGIVLRGRAPHPSAPPAPPPVAAVVSPPRAPPPTPPTTVAVTVQGAPRGARVSVGGKTVGEAPGPITLGTGEAAVELTVSAGGYDPARLMVVPTHDLTVTVAMKRRPAAHRARPAIPRDLENPF